MLSLKRFLLTILGMLIGFALSLMGVMLPWLVRNKYLNILAIVAKRILQSDTVIVFLTDTAFNTEESVTIMRARHENCSHA